MERLERCGWVGDDPLYEAYHDREWGVPMRDGGALWEQLSLEAFQAGLSWITILRKREGFRAAFADFAPEAVARFGADDVARLMADPGIVRHRGKIEATIGNARAFLTLEAGAGFAAFLWAFVDGVPVQGARAILGDVPARTVASTAMSNALRAQGFRFCGPTTCYAFMQAAGLVNDHLTCCHRHDAVAAMGQRSQSAP